MLKIQSVLSALILAVATQADAGGFIVTQAPVPVAYSYGAPSDYYLPVGTYAPAVYFGGGYAVPIAPVRVAPVYIAPVQLSPVYVAPVYAAPVMIAPAPVVVTTGYVPSHVVVREYSGHHLLPSYSYSHRIGPFGGLRVREVIR